MVSPFCLSFYWIQRCAYYITMLMDIWYIKASHMRKRKVRKVYGHAHAKTRYKTNAFKFYQQTRYKTNAFTFYQFCCFGFWNNFAHISTTVRMRVTCNNLHQMSRSHYEVKGHKKLVRTETWSFLITLKITSVISIVCKSRQPTSEIKITLGVKGRILLKKQLMRAVILSFIMCF